MASLPARGGDERDLPAAFRLKGQDLGILLIPGCRRRPWLWQPGHSRRNAIIVIINELVKWYGLYASTDFGTNRKPSCDFLLVNNTNLHPISHRLSDVAQY